jgi:hypothetical protein
MADHTSIFSTYHPWVTDDVEDLMYIICTKLQNIGISSFREDFLKVSVDQNQELPITFKVIPRLKWNKESFLFFCGLGLWCLTPLSTIF